MSSIAIEINSIIDLGVDAVVNAANRYLRAGGGVCGVIFSAAGYEPLQEACMAIGGCETGDAVATPAFALRAKIIIHAVGPVWDADEASARLLASAYRRSLEVAAENGCASVGFPLISNGIFGCPDEDAWRVALSACLRYFADHPERDVDVRFAVISYEKAQLGRKILAELQAGR